MTDRHVSRRTFVTGLAAAPLGIMAAGKEHNRHYAKSKVLAGSTFDLAVDALPVDYTGRPAVHCKEFRNTEPEILRLEAENSALS